MFHTHAIIHILSYGTIWLIALYFLKPKWRSKESLIIFVSIFLASVIDIDHVLATPIYDPLRCSIGFHPLHSYWILPLYLAGTLFQKTRWFCLGVITHLTVDAIACI